MKKAEQLVRPAPMPENPVDARLAGLLVPAPHVVPEKKAKQVATGTRKSSRFQVSDDSEADSSPEGEEEEEDSLPEEGERKRKASPTGEAKMSKWVRRRAGDFYRSGRRGASIFCTSEEEGERVSVSKPVDLG